MNESEAWYLRKRGQTFGPYTAQQLSQLRNRGQISRYHELSRDKVEWQTAEQMGLFSDREETVKPRQLEPSPGQVEKEYVSPSPVVKSVRRSWVAACIVLTLLLLLAALGGVVYYVILPATRTTSIVKAILGNEVGDVVNIQAGIDRKKKDDIYKECVCLIVSSARITYSNGKYKDIPTSTGSGFVVSNNGHIVTNKHVIEDFEEFSRSEDRRNIESKYGVKCSAILWVFFGKENKYEAKVVHSSNNYDMAIIKIDREDCPYRMELCLADPPKIPTGVNVFVIGFPGIDRAPLTSTDFKEKELRDKQPGPIESKFLDAAFVLSNRNGTITKEPFEMQYDITQKSFTIQHSATIYPGNSGGPLVTKSGLVLGINTWGKNEPGIGYSLTVLQLKKEIEKHVKGITWRELSERDLAE